ncbi:hypothetical protein BofuT4_P037880.1 [Botrytis cinerea T4]|uniref:2EXR domain-containing protein n=1 Tax=Botryotinia fuckeliana (strain T4) TaxID=999810 RepID=G2Y568_BOTF4|nr:hypothetical protein BofuT4_P037880.1 [Botrytis cinerea T4]
MAKLKKPRASRPRKSTSLTTFTLFLKLVPELRSMIWELASFQDPRNISIGKYPIFVRQAGHPPWIVINDVEDFWANSRIHSYDGNVETGPVLKLHDCDRSSAYDLAQKFIDNGLKFLAVDTGNDEDKFEVYFEAIYPWGCLVEEQIFFSSRQKMFNSQFDRRKGGVRRILPWSAFPAMFEIHGENRGCIPPQDGQVSQTAGQTWPTIISPMRFRISLARDRYSLR